MGHLPIIQSTEKLTFPPILTLNNKDIDAEADSNTKQNVELHPILNEIRAFVARYNTTSLITISNSIFQY